MLKRDSLTAQMQQLSQVLAKVKRLIIEDHEEEAKELVFSVLQEYYQLSYKYILSSSEEDFIEKIRDKNMKSEEINMLAYFLDEYAGLQEELADQLNLYSKYLLLVSMLDEEYQFVSIDHISRKTVLQEQLARIKQN